MLQATKLTFLQVALSPCLAHIAVIDVFDNSTIVCHRTMSGVLQGLNTLMLMTSGSGTLYHISYGSVLGYANTHRSKTINATGENRWVVGFSYTYNKYAFIWEGSGEATYRVGTGLSAFPVGRSWNNATTVNWDSPIVSNADATSLVTGPFLPELIAWIIPPPI